MGWGVSECHLGLFVIRCLMTLPPAVAPGASGWRGLADTSGTATSSVSRAFSAFSAAAAPRSSPTNSCSRATSHSSPVSVAHQRRLLSQSPHGSR